MSTTWIVAAALGLGFLLLSYWGSSHGPTQTGPAQVISKKLELSRAGTRWSDNWNRLVSFRLLDGEIIELYVTRQEFEEIQEGQQGQLTWQKENLTSFDVSEMGG